MIGQATKCVVATSLHFQLAMNALGVLNAPTDNTLGAFGGAVG
jgi:hypothetical protein